MNKRLKIGVFGFGCVGQGLYEVLHRTRGIKADIAKICVKDKNKKRSIPLENFTFEKDDIINNPEIDLVVELIDNADEAFAIVSSAMKKGKSVVTANKKMVAEHFNELLTLQKEHNVSFLYEASCCASIPIIRNLEEYYDNDLLTAVEGIINGTTNYILTNMCKYQMPYSEALAKAQELGFAESNPYLDVEAFDAKFKVSIITAHAFGVFIKPEEIFNYGISSISPYDISYAREKDMDIKLVARSKRNNDTLGVWVMPQFIPSGSKLYQVLNEYNGVLVEGVFSDKQFFLGKGAGAYPTGSAVLSDISAVTYNYQYEYKKFGQESRPEFTNDLDVEIYYRFRTPDELSKLPFSSVHEQYTGREYCYAIGTTTIEQLRKVKDSIPTDCFICLMPEKSF